MGIGSRTEERVSQDVTQSTYSHDNSIEYHNPPSASKISAITIAANSAPANSIPVYQVS